MFDVVNRMQSSEMAELERQYEAERQAREELRAAQNPNSKSLSQLNSDDEERAKEEARLGRQQDQIQREVAAVVQAAADAEKKPETHFPPPPMKHPS